MADNARKLFDADIHPHYPSATAISPYLEDPNVVKYYGGSGSGVPNPRGAHRQDSVPPGGGMPASDPRYMVDHHLDRYGVDLALLNYFGGGGGTNDPDLAAQIATATNDWLINEWFPVDNRFLGTITISPLDPEQAAVEIRRLGSNPRMVQVGCSSTTCLLGNPFMHPIYEACDEFGLPFNFHAPGGATFAIGAASTFAEYHTAMPVPGLHHLMSMVFEGVFVKYPNTRLVFNEFGVAWLPFVMWRSDMEYRAAREDVPWLTRLPSRYIREFVRFSTQPLEVPENPKDLVTLLSVMDGDRMLMFSSDYPHWDFDSPDSVLAGFPDDWKQRIYWDNAIEFYGVDEQLGCRPAVTALTTA